MIKYDYVPDAFGIGLTVPVSKSANGNCFFTDDYRGITISSVLSKIFEHCILVKYSLFFTSSESQFGFKKKSGVSHAIYSVRKTVDYFIERDSTVSACALDLP